MGTPALAEVGKWVCVPIEPECGRASLRQGWGEGPRRGVMVLQLFKKTRLAGQTPKTQCKLHTHSYERYTVECFRPSFIIGLLLCLLQNRSDVLQTFLTHCGLRGMTVPLCLGLTLPALHSPSQPSALPRHVPFQPPGQQNQCHSDG